jgi:CubicO group peptidase (beta-lactamase class C family)
MQLYEQGKLKLDDTIDTPIGFHVQIPSCTERSMTFRQLMTHTSGIKDNWDIIDRLTVQGADSAVSLEEFITGYLTPRGKYYSQTKNFQSGCPGSVFAYSNVGCATLGYLVQRISGIPYEQYVSDRIFTPLRMTNTSFRLSGLDQSLIALPNGNGQHEGIVDSPAGALRTTPANLGKLLIAYMNRGQYNGRQILRATSVQEMLKSQTPVESAWGLTWYTSREYGDMMWGHAGSMPGAASVMFFAPVTKTGILLAYNADFTDSTETVKKLLDEASKY